MTNDPTAETIHPAATRAAAAYAELPPVEAVVLAGSAASTTADAQSDLDLYVYVREALPLPERARIAQAHASQAEIDNRFWEPSDEWIDRDSGIKLDVMFRDVRWIEEQIDRVLVHHQAALGYSTCLWYNVLHTHVLFDRMRWFGELQERASQPYPDELRRAIVAKNEPVLHRIFSAYQQQLVHAVARDDLVSVNHRVAALLASYFDILFALNRQPHPGEKRLLALAEAHCAQLPQHMRADVTSLLQAAGSGSPQVLTCTTRLLDRLAVLLHTAGLRPIP